MRFVPIYSLLFAFAESFVDFHQSGYPDIYKLHSFYSSCVLRKDICTNNNSIPLQIQLGRRVQSILKCTKSRTCVGLFSPIKYNIFKIIIKVNITIFKKGKFALQLQLFTFKLSHLRDVLKTFVQSYHHGRTSHFGFIGNFF